MKDKKKNNENNKLDLRKSSKSGLAKFIQRPLPDEEEVSDFEKTVNKEIRQDEIENNLSEIYQDKKGNLVDVTNENFKKKKNWFLIIFKNLFLLAILASGVYLAYYYFAHQLSNTGEARIEIIAPDRISLGEEFSYTIKYYNSASVPLNNVSLEVFPPDSFIVYDYSTEPSIYNFWDIGTLNPAESRELTITGAIFNRHNSPNTISAKINYEPSNFSSRFSKEDTKNTILDGLGFRLAINYSSSALVGQDSEINFSFVDIAEINFDSLILDLNTPDNFSISSVTSEIEGNLEIEKVNSNRYILKNIKSELEKIDLVINYKVLEKIEDNQRIVSSLIYKEDGSDEKIIRQDNLDFKINESEISLELMINEDKSARQSINFSETLNYSLKFENKGKDIVNDLVLMLIIEGEMVDWTSLNENNNAVVLDQVIVWSKEHISQLAELKPNEKGEINFSIDVNNYREDDFGLDLEIFSFAQYSFNYNEDDLDLNLDNKSNEITKIINSNLSFSDEIRYFDDNNIPVGSGPLPPKVGETTSFKVYFTLKNTLHELEDIVVRLKLPEYVSFVERQVANIGQITFDEETNEVLWKINRMPLSVHRADSEFNISITPSLDDRDRILTLSPGVTIEASDTVSEGKINLRSQPKTTKLEDDSIASYFNNGLVE